MVSCRPALERSSAGETMHAVLRDAPEPLESLVPMVSPALAATVAHCLEKDPRERFQSARDLAFQLRTLPQGTIPTITGKLNLPKMRRWYATPRAAIFAVAGLLGA